MKTKKETNDLTQLNARIPRDLRRIFKAVSSLTGLKMEDSAADALRWFYGDRDEVLKQRRELCVQAFRRITEGKSPFDDASGPMAA